MISKDENGCYYALGELEAYMHDCPDPKIKGDVCNCEVYIKYSNENSNEYDESKDKVK